MKIAEPQGSVGSNPTPAASLSMRNAHEHGDWGRISLVRYAYVFVHVRPWFHTLTGERPANDEERLALGMIDSVQTELFIEEIAPEGRTVSAVIDGREVLRGSSLARLIREVGGYEGTLTQPSTGKLFPVSLMPWKDRDPHATWLVVGFTSDVADTSWLRLDDAD